MHGGDIYSNKVKIDFSVNINPFYKFRLFPWDYKILSDSFSKYPDVESNELRESIAGTYGIDPSWIITGNGASDIILSYVRAIKPEKALVIDPCFSGYARALESLGCEVIHFPLKPEEEFEISCERVAELLKILDSEKPSMLFLCNPNNPNGKLCSVNNVFKIVESCQRLGIYILLDECFMKLTGKESEYSFMKMICSFNKLLVLDAFTKSFSVPGLRLGFGFTSNLEIINKIRNQFAEWNVSSVAQKVGIMCLKRHSRIKLCAKKISVERNFLVDGLKSLGLRVFTSDANYILFFCDISRNLGAKLLQKGILIRDCRDYENLSDGYYRISVRNHSDNKKLLKIMKKVLKDK